MIPLVDQIANLLHKDRSDLLETLIIKASSNDDLSISFSKEIVDQFWPNKITKPYTSLTREEKQESLHLANKILHIYGCHQTAFAAMCKIYFDIAAYMLGESMVRRLRDKVISSSPKQGAGKMYIFSIDIPSEDDAGIMSGNDIVTVIVDSGNPGGDKVGEEFKHHIQTALADWYESKKISATVIDL